MWFSKRQQGVISVFLLICFTMTFVFSGLLVDGARIRVAKMLAEGSLDTAASSVLSYYDELLFDLYGLFAVEDPDMEKIKARMDQYFEETLALVPGDHTELKKMLNDSVEQAFFDGYDFEVELVKVGSNFNLGQTQVTQAQIVEYMKYRAPLQLIDSEYGFLNNLQGLLEIKDRLVAVKNKNEITKKHKSSIESGGTLVDKLNEFKDDCEKLLNNPLGKGSFEDTVNNAINEYDEGLRVAFEGYCQTLIDIENSRDEDGNIPEPTNSQLESKLAEYITQREDLEKEFFDDVILALQQMMSEYLETDKNLKQQVDTYVKNMQAYINELQANYDSGNEETKTVFGPEIELCKATVGEVIINKGVLLKAELYLNPPTTFDRFKTNITSKVNEQFMVAATSNGRDSEHERLNWESINASIRNDNNAYIQDIFDKITNLRDACEDFTYVKEETKSPTYKPNNLKDVEDLGSESKDEHDDTYKQGMRKIDTKLLEGAVADEIDDVESEEFDLNETYNKDANEAADTTFDKGIDLMETLMGLLEKARDEIYVDEYILANCRNYVHHYNMDKDKAGKTENGTEYDHIIAEKFFEPKYQNKQYMVAEIEYILAGNADQYLNVAFVSGEILLFRTAFNLAAIFTDSSMYQQASTICAAAGPFAPLATFALMVAWAVAESVIDVVDIMAGKKVLLFKKGKDWNISVQGAVKRLVGDVIDGVANAAFNEGKYYLNQVTEKYNGAIYDYYTASGNLTSGLDEAQKLADELKVGNYTGDWISTAKNSVNNLDNIVGDVNNEIQDAKDKVITKISDSYNSARDSVSNAVANNFVTPEQPYVSGAADNDSIKLGYTDYLRILLLMENSTKKMERLQQVIQVNMRQQENHDGFQMINSHVNVWGEANCSVKYLFMTDALVPQNIRLSGRFQFTVKANRTY